VNVKARYKLLIALGAGLTLASQLWVWWPVDPAAQAREEQLAGLHGAEVRAEVVYASPLERSPRLGGSSVAIFPTASALQKRLPTLGLELPGLDAKSMAVDDDERLLLVNLVDACSKGSRVAWVRFREDGRLTLEVHAGVRPARGMPPDNERDLPPLREGETPPPPPPPTRVWKTWVVKIPAPRPVKEVVLKTVPVRIEFLGESPPP
jgi:hypothetical protein